MTGDSKPFRVTHTPFREEYGRFSPDGRLIAYLSDESGRNEVYVQSFPEASERWQISNGGACQRPLWRADGKELFYLSRDNQLMGVGIQRQPVFNAAPPRALFRLGGAVGTRLRLGHEQPCPLRRRPGRPAFPLRLFRSGAPKPPITVVVNWLPENQP